MGDRARFDVILGDKVSTSARRQAAALNELTRAFTSTSAAARAASTMGPPSIIATAAARSRSAGVAASRASAPSSGGFDANGRAARAVAKQQTAEENERRRISEGISRASQRADRDDARARQRDINERRRIADGITRASAKADRDDARAAQQRARAREKAVADQARTADRVRRAVERAQTKIAREERASQRAQVRDAARTQRAQQKEQAGSFIGRLSSGLTRSQLAVAGLQAVAGAARDAASAIAQMGVDAGRAYVDVAAFREGTISSLTTVMGSRGSARAAFRDALVMANQTPLDPQEVIGMMTSFSVGGFGERELAPLVAAASDISAARGQAASDSLVRVLTQIRGLGRVTRGDITMQALSAGLNAGDIFQDIARQMNLGTGTAGIRAAEQAVARGRVNDTVAIAAFMSSVRKRYDNGAALGTFARNQSNTLTGSFSNLKGAMFTLMASTDLANTPGLLALKNTVLAVTGALDMGAPSGIRLRNVITDLGNVVGTGLFGGITGDKVAGAFEYVLPIAQGAVGFLRMVFPLGRAFVGGLLPGLRAGLWPVMAVIRSFGGSGPATGVQMLSYAFAGLGRGLGFVVGAAGSIVAFGAAVITGMSAPAVFIASIPGMLTMALGSLYDWGAGAAEGIITGFSQGITGGAERIGGAVRGAFTGAVDTAREVLGWHSPSRVFIGAGEAVADGFRIGLNGGAPAARDAVSRLVAPQLGAGGAANGNAAARAAGGNVINISIDGRGRSDEGIVDMLVEKLSDYFEGQALMGATG